MLNEHDVSLPGGEPGREWLMESEGLILRNRSFFSKGRLYHILFITKSEVAFRSGKPSSNPKDRTELYEDIAIRFQGSFKLTEGMDASGEVDSLLGSLKGKEIVLTLCDPEKTTCLPSAPTLIGKLLSLPKPEYPAIAKLARASGTVTVQVLISEEGEVIAAQAVSGHPLLFAVSVRAARQALFSPTFYDGKPVKVTGVISYNFVAM